MRSKLITCLLLAILLSDNLNFVTCQTKQKKICLIAASYPWIFGPYQSQMYQLSLYLNSTNNYSTIYWLARVHSLKLEKGVYRDWNAVRRGLLPRKTTPAPDSMSLNHLTFLGVDHEADIDINAQSSKVSGLLLNSLAKEYNIDVFVLLLDTVNYSPNVEYLDAAVVAWLPIHSEFLHPGMADYWMVRNVHAVAGLAPFTKQATEKLINKESAIGNIPPHVNYVPHAIDRATLEKWASLGQSKLKYSLPKRILENPEETFFVLIEGGNYDNLDRKGWSEAIQAFGIFKQSLPTKEARDKVHLYLHSMESYLIEQDANAGESAPAPVLPQGQNLMYALFLSKLRPGQDYTLDMTQHHYTTVAALKMFSTLCLHVSHAEGFGLNAVECQALGVPVITTNYTAMKDFTKLGKTIDPLKGHRQLHQNYHLALPNVTSIVETLHLFHNNFLDNQKKNNTKMGAVSSKQQIQAAHDWIDQELSLQNVGAQMESTIQEAIQVQKQRQLYRSSQVEPPNYQSNPLYTIIRGEILYPDSFSQNHNDFKIKPWVLVLPSNLDFELNHQFIQNYAWSMIENNNFASNVACIPTIDPTTNRMIPFMDTTTGGPNTNLPFLLRSHWFYSMHSLSHRRISVIWNALQYTQDIKRLPDGLATLVPNNVRSFSNEL